MKRLAAPLLWYRKPPLKIYARGVVSYFYFSRAPRARAENQANQQCHFKSSRCRMELLDTDSCRGTVPMEPLMSTCNSSMRHQNPDFDFDDTGQFLQGALCTIAAQLGARRRDDTHPLLCNYDTRSPVKNIRARGRQGRFGRV
jgi:hypothetical protein